MGLSSWEEVWNRELDQDSRVCRSTASELSGPLRRFLRGRHYTRGLSNASRDTGSRPCGEKHCEGMVAVVNC